MTVAFGGIQFRYFMRSWQYLLKPEAGVSQEAQANYITPFQAFINALSASLGNGSLVGMATAMYSGGPGAGFWISFLAFFSCLSGLPKYMQVLHLLKNRQVG